MQPWLVLLGAFPASAYEEIHVYGVNNYNGTGECGACIGPNCTSDLAWTDDSTLAVNNVVTGWSTWDGDAQRHLNTNVKGKHFTDAAFGGSDTASDWGIDDADVVYFAGHGTFSCANGAGRSYSTLHMGSSAFDAGSCAVDTHDMMAGGGGQDIWVGNTDTEIVYADSCSSAQKCVFDNDGYDALDGAELLMWAGFHGNSFDSYDQYIAMRDYTAASRVSGVGDNWLDYRWINSSSADSDQCPVAMVYGSSTANTDNMYNNGGVEDWIATGSHTWVTYYYIAGCDPSNGFSL
jgi:hypothetical protein